MKRGTARHYKIFDLADALGIENYAALGLMASLWDWAAETKPAGDVGAATNRTLARAAGWTGDADVLIGAMVKAKLLDEHSVCRLMIHDWPEHCDDGVHTYMARRRMLFADGTAPRLRHLHSREREAAEAEYSAILTQKHVPSQVLDTPAECPRNVHGQNVVGTDRNGTDRNGSERNESPPQTPLPATPSLAELVWKECGWRREGKGKAIPAIIKSIGKVSTARRVTPEEAAAYIAGKAAEFTQAVQTTEMRFRPMPTTWFNAERYDDDPATWRAAAAAPLSAKAQIREDRQAREPEQDFSTLKIVRL